MEKDLMDFGKLWDEVMIKNDPGEIGSFMSDDWVIVGTEGGITPKPTFLGLIKSGVLTHDRMDSENVRVKIYGDTGILTSRGTSGGKYNDKPFSYFEWSTSVFVREHGQWRCVMTMLTPARV